VMTYASFNTGFKSGGYNASNPTDPPFAEEKLYAYEVGEKAEMLDHKLRLNSAGFYYKYDNIQIQKPEPVGSGIINGAKATLYGFDTDITAIPIKPLELSASLSLLHTKFDDFPDSPISTPGGGIPLTSLRHALASCCLDLVVRHRVLASGGRSRRLATAADHDGRKRRTHARAAPLLSVRATPAPGWGNSDPAGVPAGSTIAEPHQKIRCCHLQAAEPNVALPRACSATMAMMR